MNRISNLGRVGLAHKAFGNPIPQAAYDLIDSTEKAIKEWNPEFDALKKIRELMGYTQNGTDVVISVFQDDATSLYFVKASSHGKELWSESGISLNSAVNKAFNKHKAE